jgi:hypothetical protein
MKMERLANWTHEPVGRWQRPKPLQVLGRHGGRFGCTRDTSLSRS